jgi:hypothetical protein
LQFEGSERRLEADLAFATCAVPLFRVGIAVAGVGAAAVGWAIVRGRSLYPRSAAGILLAVPPIVLFVLPPLAPLPSSAILGPARYGVAGAALFAVSTVLLWNREG